MKTLSPEIRLVVKIFAITGAVVIILALFVFLFLKLRAPHLLEFSEGIEEHTVEVHLDSLEGARLITGMTGCENLALAEEGLSLYVTCLDGNIHYLNGTSTRDLKVLKSKKAGTSALGIAYGHDDMLYVAIARGEPQDWMTTGGAIFRFNKALDFYERLTNDFQAINGVTIDSANNVYFASSNFSFLNPSGQVYRIPDPARKSIVATEVFLEDAGMSNGLCYDRNSDRILYSSTLGGVYEFTPSDPGLKEIYLKLHFMEACDDLCADISGNIWMSDPGQGTVKMFNPGTNRLIRFKIEGVGQVSSCRIRTENGTEMLYMTELNQSFSMRKPAFDGRGVIVVPTSSLLRLLEPILIQNP
jgi:sugar lactone lactonase YvrE